MQLPQYQIAWTTPGGSLVALEPRRDEVVRHAPALAAAYNHPRNAPLLGHTESIDAGGVVDHYASVAANGGHNFLVFRGAELVADADLRNVSGDAAEFAFLVISPAAQGKGLGTQVATLVHAFGFVRLGLERIYASIIPRNTASRRVFEKLGHRIDDSPGARKFADEPDDITMMVERAEFERAHARVLAEIRIAPRP